MNDTLLVPELLVSEIELLISTNDSPISLAKHNTTIMLKKV